MKSISEEIILFSSSLGAKVIHRGTTYVNLDVFGAQITLKEIPHIQPDLPELHFGFNLGLKEFDEISNSIVKHDSSRVAIQASIVDANTPMERKIKYLRSPSGYLIELKGYI